MTADAVLMHHLLSGFVNEDNLRFEPKGKHGSVAHSVFCLEKIFVENIVVWNMAIVAMCYPAVRTVRPCGILGRHYVAVGAGLRIVRKIGIRLRNVENKE